MIVRTRRPKTAQTRMFASSTNISTFRLAASPARLLELLRQLVLAGARRRDQRVQLLPCPAQSKPPEDLQEVLNKARLKGGLVTDDEADALRDFCGECLQVSGFGPGYEPTQKGQRLERLIDQLFVG